MAQEDLESRMRALEERIARLERAALGRDPAAAGQDDAASARASLRSASNASAQPGGAPSIGSAAQPVRSASPAWLPWAPWERTASGAESRGTRESAITNTLGWGGALALVLAAAYLIRMAVSAGWLTPGIQIGAASLFGTLLIGAGFTLKGSRDGYAGLLPAAGIVILFLSIYGAHLLYHLVGAHLAGTAIIGVCAISLALCAAFDSDLYALFAVAGSYSAPFLLVGSGASFADLAVYYCAWSVTFTAFSIARGRRLIYLVALYAALVGFDAAARSHGVDWRLAVAFQLAQFLIFGVGAVAFSIRRRAPLDRRAALLHLPALLLFYVLQYAALHQHLPRTAPWIAVASLACVALLYLAARLVLRRPSPGGQLLLGAYAALVLFHAVYLESIPANAKPWAGVGFLAVTLATRRGWRAAGAGLWPLLTAVGAIFILNVLRIFWGFPLDAGPVYPALGLVYAAMLYLGNALIKDEPRLSRLGGPLLFAGHLTAMAATVRLLAEPILQSVAWALLALLTMGWSLYRRDRLVGQSSLLLFAATAVKVVIYDLAGARPLARVVSLVVLGIAFYVGGLLYRRVARMR